MPKKIYGHRMITMDKDIVVIGGSNYGHYLHQMTCQNKRCFWQTFSQQLKIGRMNFVTILAPDDSVVCGRYYSYFKNAYLSLCLKLS